jgi:hypothetical protein
MYFHEVVERFGLDWEKGMVLRCKVLFEQGTIELTWDGRDQRGRGRVEMNLDASSEKGSK